MRRKKILCIALVIAALSTTSVWKASAASTEMPNGTVVIGAKAFALGYANDSKNLAEITSLIVAGGAIYVKGFDAVWINNNTSASMSSSIVPAVTYKSATGVVGNYAAGDKPAVLTDELEVISIE
jgi:hypothetical protein